MGFLSDTGAVMYQQPNMSNQMPQNFPVPCFVPNQKTSKISQMLTSQVASTPAITHSAQPIMFNQTPVAVEKPKKKKPSPSAKRRSRARLLAFLEQKKKAAVESGQGEIVEDVDNEERSKSPDEGCDISEKISA